VLDWHDAAMRIIFRYVYREAFSHALLGLAVFTFVFFVPQLVRLMELVVRHSGTAGELALLFVCPFAPVLAFTLPMATLVGVLLGLGRLSADGEIVALNASGISLRKLLLPLGALAIGGAAATACVTLWLGPASLRTLHRLEDSMRASQASIALQPRVFDERFPHMVLYVEDVDATGTQWRGVFLAEQKGTGQIDLTLAQSAIVVDDRQTGSVELHLGAGSTHEYDPADPQHYGFTAFRASDLPIQVTEREAAQQVSYSASEMGTRQVVALARGNSKDAQVELQRRLAFPAACMVFALLGVPVGVRPRRGGRSAGVIVTLLVVTGYYFVFVAGLRMAQQGALPPVLGVWLANLLVGVVGLLLVRRIESFRSESRVMGGLDAAIEWVEKRWGRRQKPGSSPGTASEPVVVRLAETQRGMHTVVASAAGFPLLLDTNILSIFTGYFFLMLAGFVVLFDAFTLFDMLQDISRNHVPLTVVANYFRFLGPLMVYQLAPLAALVATMVTLGVMAKNNEVTAFKASGVSLYRLTLPLIVAGALLSCGMFLLDDTYLPYANQRQDALRNQIKRHPAQTYYHPTHQWILGEGQRIYNYELFDYDAGLFGGLNVYELDPQTFQMKRRVYATRAHWEPAISGWVLEQGWVRDFKDGQLTTYMPFRVMSLADLAEPPKYFRREVLPSSQMNWVHLGDYIQSLKKAGFDTARLQVEWQKKFAFPLIATIIIFLAAPFAFLAGTRGAVGALALAVGIGIVYWAAAALFEALGAVGQLPPLAAGWASDAIFTFLGIYFFLKMPT
jgi:LPS export ABC transporter permease LptF/LPS export ABC transporter permease LptG